MSDPRSQVAIEIRDTIRTHSPLADVLNDIIICYAVSVENAIHYGETIYPRNRGAQFKPPWQYDYHDGSGFWWDPLELRIDPDEDVLVSLIVLSDNDESYDSWSDDPDTAMTDEYIEHYRKRHSRKCRFEESIPQFKKGYDKFIASCLHDLITRK